ETLRVCRNAIVLLRTELSRRRNVECSLKCAADPRDFICKRILRTFVRCSQDILECARLQLSLAKTVRTIHRMDKHRRQFWIVHHVERGRNRTPHPSLDGGN